MKLWLLLLLTSCTGAFMAIPEESGRIDVFFCDKHNCSSELEKQLLSPADCALYSIDSQTKAFLKENKARVVIDEIENFPNAKKEFGKGLMHNKFCVFDHKVWTGSWNPGQTIPNNVVLIESKIVASAFKKEFEELWSGIFHGGHSKPAKVKINGSLVEVYFCPEDNCKENVISTLKKAEGSIRFMTFSFTDDDIGDLLLEKSNEINISGIFDPKIDKRWSEYEKLSEFSVKRTIHHKVFIVDNEVVITGSYNPTKNGNTRNDENVVIIHNKEIAKKFVEEFERLRN